MAKQSINFRTQRNKKFKNHVHVPESVCSKTPSNSVKTFLTSVRVYIARRLVNLLHGAVASLRGRGSFGGSLSRGRVVLLDVEAELDELVNALSEASRLLDCEARHEKGGLEQKLDDGLDGTVVLTVSFNLLFELLDDRRLGGDLKGLLGGHVAGHGGITEGLGLHNTLHVGRPTKLAGSDGARGEAELLVVTLLFLDLLGLGILIRNLLLSLLLNVEVDGVGDELGVLLDNLLDLALIQVFSLLVLEVEDNRGTTAELLALGVSGDAEGTTSTRLPDVLLVIVVLGDDSDLVGNEQIKWSSTYSLGHTNTGIPDGQSLGLLVGDDINAQVLSRVELGRVGQGLVADLVQSIGGIGNKFSQEDFFVGVDSVDDEGEKLRDLSLELESLRHCDGYLKEELSDQG
ncbi:hypothetical protein VCV18_006717 [Metarhizium anisopliae]